jgi:dTDP-4-amino-4,6-dideoxygalactose transaminase
MIPVTKPYLPQREAYEQYIKDIWQRGWLTNNGPLVNELEARLCAHLGMPNVLLLNNGTIALQIALKALDNYYSFFVCGNYQQHFVGRVQASVCGY